MQEKSTTGDELAHITGGYNFNHWDDFRMHPENGILPQRWQTLPLVLSGVNYPSLAEDSWKKSDVWLLGYRFFYLSGNDHLRMLAAARAMNSLFGAATTFLVFFWARGLWGTLGAMVAAGFCAFCPTMLAHSGVATSDMCMALFFLLALGIYWRHLHDGRWAIAGISTVVFGLAAVAKHSSLLLLPMVLVLVLVRLFHAEPLRLGARIFSSWRERIGFVSVSLLVHGLVVVASIWAFFGFRFSAFNPILPAGEFTFPWEQMLSFGGAKAALIQFCRTWHLLPEGYLYGLAFVLKHAESRGAFLDGEYSLFGWVLFFPKAFLYKTPPSLLVGLTASATLLVSGLRKISAREWGKRLYRVAPLLTLFVIYWAVSLTSHLNIGHRHLLPIYPVLYLFCGALGWAVTRAWRKSRATGTGVAVAVAALLTWHGAIAAAIYPNFLAYFSPIAGGPAEGYKHLVDSSLDWGQDLPGLKKWLTVNVRDQDPVYLSYFGTSEPDFYGIKAVRLAMLPNFDRAKPLRWSQCSAGVYALSASMLQHVYMPQRGDWTRQDEHRYQELKLNEATFRMFDGDPAAHPELLQGLSAPNWEKAWRLYAQLRFARLCHYLRARQPDATIGYSILIYRLDRHELDSALNGSLRDLATAIEKAISAPKRSSSDGSP